MSISIMHLPRVLHVDSSVVEYGGNMSSLSKLELSSDCCANVLKSMLINVNYSKKKL